MNYYEILGVEKDASADDIKNAFRSRARELHPDVNKAPDAEERFKELGKAYDTLSDDEKRSLYDRYGEDGLRNAGYTSGPFDFGFGDISDIFSSFFGGGFDFSGGYTQRVNPNAPQRGRDLRLDIEISFEEAVFGVEKEVKIDHFETCAECNSTGIDKNSKETVCKTCGGQGRVQQSAQTILGSFTTVTTCPTCRGSGKNPGAYCKPCKGVGAVEREKTISVKIPHGVDNGSKIRVSGEGDAGKNGGPAGDLYIILHVAQSKEFLRDGFDIYSTVTVSTPQAVLGDKVKVKTLEGEAEVQIAAGSQQGDKITLKHFGVPVLGRNDQRGNHYVTILIEVPKHLTDEERNLYQKLFEISKNKKNREDGGILDKIKNSFRG